MQDRLHVCENFILAFYREKHNLPLNFFLTLPVAVEIHLLILEGAYKNLSNSKQKSEK